MILPTHKTSITYIEYCRVVAADDRLAYVKSKNGIEKHFSIPFGNTNIILLGPGTSLTQQAAFFLSSEGVMIGFVGGGATPLYFASQNEYRPTEYMQNWMKIWQDEQGKLNAAKFLQIKRVDFVQKIYNKHFKAVNISELCNIYRKNINLAQNKNVLMGYEANFVKAIYKLWADFNNSSFTRIPKSSERVNKLIDNGNYLAYGLAASMLWVLGISHSFAVSHGDTRRGGLVFDAADLIKDSIILPLAFQNEITDLDTSQFRKEATQFLDDCDALKYLFEVFVEVCNNQKKVLDGSILARNETQL